MRCGEGPAAYRMLLGVQQADGSEIRDPAMAFEAAFGRPLFGGLWRQRGA